MIARRQRGMALPAVLLLLMLAGALAALLLQDARRGVDAARLLKERAQASARIDAALLQTGLRLAGGENVPDSLAGAETMQGGVRIRLQDLSGRIDINLAPALLLENLFRQAGIGEARGVVRAILRRREQRRFLPPFLDLSELLDLPGMDAASFRRVAPFLTTLSATAGIDPRWADETVLAAVPGVGRDRARRFIAGGRREMRLIEAGRPYFIAAPGRAYRVVAETGGADGGRFLRLAVISLLSTDGRPFVFLPPESGYETVGGMPIAVSQRR